MTPWYRGRAGSLVPARDPAALANAIAALVADPALRARLGTQARQRVERHFSLETCVQRYVNVYRRAGDIGRTPVRAIIDPPVEQAILRHGPAELLPARPGSD